MPQKVWAIGEEVLAADFNAYVQQQVVPVFTNVAQRDAQWAAPPTGALCVTADTLTVWQYTGAAWVQYRQQTWYGYNANGQTISTGGSVFTMLNTPTLPPGDYLVSIAASYTYAQNTMPQISARVTRNAVAIGDAMNARGAQTATATARTPFTVATLVKADAGGNITWGLWANNDASTPAMGPAQITVQRVLGM